MSTVIVADSNLNDEAVDYIHGLYEYSTVNMEQYKQRSLDLSWLDGFQNIVYFVLAALVILLVFIIIKNWDSLSEWFFDVFFSGRRKSNNKSQSVVESDSLNIFGHDYDGEIADCVRNQNFAMAVRLLYLKTLHYMESHNCIKWAESKTATEYYYEYSNKKRKPLFHELTSLYLIATYADSEGSSVGELAFQHAKELNQQITKL